MPTMRPHLALAVLSLAGCFVDSMPTAGTPAATTSASAATGESTAPPDPTTTTVEGTTSSTTTSSTTAIADTTTAAATGDLTTDATTTGGLMCIDASEPTNDLLENSPALPPLGCKDLPEQFTGVLGAADDVDWITYRGEWTPECLGDPRLTHNISSSAPLQLCVYTRCLSRLEDVVCTNAIADTTPGGDPGCCSSQAFEMDVNCPGTDETMDVFLRVDSDSAGVCIDYKITYAYHEFMTP